MDGDACLRAISAALQGVLRRPGDMAARFGGEEFAILLPETDTAGAIQIVGDMQAAFRALAIRHEAGPHGVVTLSAGVASWCPGGLMATPAWLVEAADAALYEAKTLAATPSRSIPTSRRLRWLPHRAQERRVRRS